MLCRLKINNDFCRNIPVVKNKIYDMRLSEVPTGQEVVIVKVLGYGAFCKRIIEMGFVRGKKVKVLLNAPLRDPVKYEILGYEVSLRRSEAALIEVMTLEEARNELQTEAGEVVVDEELQMQKAADPVEQGHKHCAGG